MIDLESRCRQLAEGIAALPVEAWDQPWANRVAGLIALSMEEVIAETRKTVVTELLANCLRASEEAEAMAVEIVRNSEEAQKRKLRLEGRAMGIRAVAGMIGQLVNGTKHEPK